LRRKTEYRFAFSLWLLLLLLLAGPASAGLITFDEPGLVHGQIIDDEYQSLQLTISVDAVQGPDVAVLYDTELRNVGPTFEDLEYPLDQQGNILVLQANTTGCGDGVCDVPDDIGARPAGQFILDFGFSLAEFGLDILDVDSLAENGSLSFFSSVEGGGFVQVGSSIGFDELADPNSPFFRGFNFGNNGLSVIAPLTANDVGGSFDRVVVSMGGSGGIDNLTYTAVPEPGTVALLGVGLAGLAVVGRRRSES
jgi:hypothetical protein